MTRLPVASEPVNAILSTPACAVSGAPASVPRPVSTLSTPGGTPAAATTSASAWHVSDAFSDGFSTAAHPAASAGATFQVAISNG